MSIYNRFLIYTIVLILSSCGQDRPQEDLTKEDLIAALIPEQDSNIHHFQLEANDITISTTTEGVNIWVPQNSVAYADGSAVTEPINVQFRAYTSIEDMLVRGLETVADNELLVSGAMFEIKATVPSGKELKIVDPWRIELPVQDSSLFRGGQVFEGNIKEGKIQWTNPQPPDMRLVPIPFDVLQKKLRLGELDIFSITSPYIDLPTYQNTWLATPQFYFSRYKLVFLNFRSIAYYDFNLDPYSHGQRSCSFDRNLFSIFRPNVQLPLYQVNPFILAKAKTELARVQKEGYVGLCDYEKRSIHNKKGSLRYNGFIQTTEKFIESGFKKFNSNKSIQYTTIDDRFLLSVDSLYLRQKMEDYLRMIKYKNDSIKAANDAILAKNKKEHDAFLAKLKRRQDSIYLARKKELEKNIAKYQKEKAKYKQLQLNINNVACSASKFTWYNFSYFCFINKTTDAKKGNLKILPNQETQRIFLVIKEQNTIVQFRNHGKDYELNGISIPEVPAYIIATHIDDKGQLNYGYKSIDLKPDLEVKLNIDKSCAVHDFKKVLNQILNE